MGNVQIVRGRKEFKITDPTQLSLVQELAPIQKNLVVYTGTVGEASAGQVPAHGRLQLTKVRMCGKGEARIRMPPRVSPAQRDLPRKPFVLMEAPRWTEITTALVSGDHRTSQADVILHLLLAWQAPPKARLVDNRALGQGSMKPLGLSKGWQAAG